MKAVIIGLLNVVLNAVSPDLLKTIADSILDTVENAVVESSSTVDDLIVLPICRKVREAFDITDDDELV